MQEASVQFRNQTIALRGSRASDREPKTCPSVEVAFVVLLMDPRETAW
jgi:hypothetical protein